MTMKKIKPAYPYSEWEIVEENFTVENNFRSETVFALGNGYMGFRGNFEEGYQGPEGTGVDGIYINGFYESEIIKYPEIAFGYAENSQTMLNVTKSRIIKLFVEDEEFSMNDGTLEEYRRVLSLKEGILGRSLIWSSQKGKKVKIDIQRLVSFCNKHLAVINYEVTPINFSGNIKLVSMLDGNVTNLTAGNDPRTGSGLHGRVLFIDRKEIENGQGLLVQGTGNSCMHLACAMENHMETRNEYTLMTAINKDSIEAVYEVKALQGAQIRLIKYISYVTSRDFEYNDLADAARAVVMDARVRGYKTIKNEQSDFLMDFWNKADVQIKGDLALQQGIRFNLFHLLQAAGRDGKTNVGAKGLTGEGYEGHYFWDTEMYILPFFTYSNPETGRKLLEYRYGTLEKARERARQMSHQRGALFPWRTINGEECSAYFPGGTAQYHINADVAFAVKRYLEATDDQQFMLKFGAEMLFETARLWEDLGEYIPAKGNKFCINCVTGPDEYTAIVNNNCYTNLMARENLLYACETAERMKDGYPEEYASLADKIGLEDQEIAQWKNAAENMYIPYNSEMKIYLQDDSFMDKTPWDFSNTPSDKYPLLLHYHPLVIYRHQVCKQADLVLAQFLLGSRFTKEEKKVNFDFYERATTHDSSLSTAIFSIMASEIGYREKAYDYFISTARMDLDDYHGNTKDGIHAANMAGTWMCLVNGFAGMRVYKDMLSFTPYLPESWQEYSFSISYRGRQIRVKVGREGTEYILLKGREIDIMHNGEKKTLRKEKKVVRAVLFDLDGVIVSTDECHYKAWKRLADEEGIYFDRKINERLRGVSRMESLEIILEKADKEYTKEQKLALSDRKNSFYKELIKELTPNDILPGVKKLLHEIKDNGIKIAIGSSSKNSPLILERINLDNFFDITVDGNDISKSKPDPEVFLKGAERLGFDPEQCIVVEDADAGIEAALAGGMRVIGIGGAFDNKRATMTARDLTTVSIDDILNL